MRRKVFLMADRRSLEYLELYSFAEPINYCLGLFLSVFKPSISYTGYISNSMKKAADPSIVVSPILTFLRIIQLKDQL